MTMHISREHRAIILPYRHDVATMFPHARMFEYLGEQMIALPHGLEETRVLRNLNIPAPAPIAEHYSFPSRQQPFEVQVRTCGLMTTNQRAYVLNGLGTGKTRTALWSFDWLRQNGDAHRMLVVCPLSIMNFVWMREISDILPGYKTAILHGDRGKRARLLADQSHDIYIINHDGVPLLEAELIARNDIDVVVLDELSIYRNARADRSRATRRVTANKRWVWGLTGSPTPNAPTDAFGLVKMITPERAPMNFSSFRTETMEQVSQFKWVARKTAKTAIANLLQPAVRFTLDEVVELPELVERQMDVPQGPRQAKAYEQLRKEAVAIVKGGAVTAVNGGVVMNKMLQASCGYLYLDNGKVENLDNEDRLEILMQIIESTERKTIVFAPYLHAIAGIAKCLSLEKMDFTIITGDVAKGQRDITFNTFQNTNRIKVLVAHPGTMAHGLTLTAADTIVWFGPTTSLEIFEQANARIRRVGQKHKQQVFMLQGTKMERELYARLRDKRDVQNGILDILADLTEHQ